MVLPLCVALTMALWASVSGGNFFPVIEAAILARHSWLRTRPFLAELWFLLDSSLAGLPSLASAIFRRCCSGSGPSLIPRVVPAAGAELYP